MIKIVRPEKPYTPHGDIDIYGEQHAYMAALDWQDVDKMNPMPITGSCSFSINPWNALLRAGIADGDVLKLKKWSKNYCPCSIMNYHAIVPIAILTNDASVYTKNLPEMFRDLHEDGLWNREMGWGDDDAKDVHHHLSSIDRAILGSGYTDCILPSDGSNSLIFATIPLDNDDKIIVIGWEWYNK